MLDFLFAKVIECFLVAVSEESEGIEEAKLRIRDDVKEEIFYCEMEFFFI